MNGHKVWYVHYDGVLFSHKENSVLIHATAWMKPTITLSERSQSRQSCINDSTYMKRIEYAMSLGEKVGKGCGKELEVVSSTSKASFWTMDMSWSQRVMRSQLCDYNVNHCTEHLGMANLTQDGLHPIKKNHKKEENENQCRKIPLSSH